VHSLVECSAAAALQAAYAADLRRGLEARRARRAGGKRRHSADASRPRARQAGFGRHSLDVRPPARLAARAPVHGREPEATLSSWRLQAWLFRPKTARAQRPIH